MNDGVSLRPFAIEDAEQVFDMLQYISAYRPDPRKLTELAQIFVGQKESYACVAMYNQNVVGFGCLFEIRRVRGGYSAIIEDMVISPDFRRQGIGRMILQNLLVEAKRRGCFKVTLESSEVGEQFYLAAGFEIGGHIMKKKLSQT